MVFVLLVFVVVLLIVGVLVVVVVQRRVAHRLPVFQTAELERS